MSDDREALERLTYDEPRQLLLQSPLLVLIDPLALDMNQDALRALAGVPEAERRRQLAALPTTLRIGIHAIDGFTPGVYEIGPGDVEPAGDTGPDVVDVDCGAIVAVDLANLPALADVLTWDAYDAMLTADGAATTRELVEAMGGPRFVVLGGNADRPFAGDGVYRLRAGAPRRIGDGG